MNSVYFDKRKSGVSLIGDLTWGTHFCQFYQTKKDLLDILLPYFRAGLENNEFCVWVTSKTLGVDAAWKALKKAVPHFEKYAQKGQIEIISDSRWNINAGKSGRAIICRVDKANSNGFDGLRFACSVFSEKRGGKSVSSYFQDEIVKNNAIAVFSYPRDKFGATGLMEVVKDHQFALVRDASGWKLIKSSEAKIVKDALKRSEEKLRFLFSNMSEGFAYHKIVLDDRGSPCDYIFIEINKAFEKLTGLKKENIIGKKITEILPAIKNDPADWIGKYGKVSLSGKPLFFESYSQVLKKWYSVSAFSAQKGYFAVTFSDITKRKQSEETLKWSEKRNLILSESSSLLLEADNPQKAVDYICKETMQFLDCHVFFNFLSVQNPNRLYLNAYYGIPEKEAKRIQWLDYGVAICGSVAESGKRVIVENIFSGKNPRTELLRAYGVRAYCCHPLRIGKEVLGTISFGTQKRDTFSQREISMMKATSDIVAVAMQRKRAEDVLKRDKELFEKLVNEKSRELIAAQIELDRTKRLSDIGTLAATVAHELRNPLASINMASHNIKRKAKNPALDKHLANIQKKVSESAQIIDNLLFYSRIRPPDYESVSLFNILQECADSVKEQDKKQVLVKKRIDSIKESIEADALQMKEVFANLLNNAYDAVSETMGEIEITGEEQGGFIEVCVNDNGIGIDKDNIDRIFDPFFTTKPKGTGLGLPLCKQIVNLHGGSINIQSLSGKGTSVIVRLPKRRDK